MVCPDVLLACISPSSPLNYRLPAMTSESRSTRQVAAILGVPYTTLLKWQTLDRLLRPELGAGGRRGGDRWSELEVRLAEQVVLLREAGLPVRFIREAIDLLRSESGTECDASVHLSLHLRDRSGHVRCVAIGPIGHTSSAPSPSLRPAHENP